MRSIIRLGALSGALLSLSLGAACGPGRTAAATQSTPKAFDATKSDPKAIELADQMITACGGQAAWDKVKELRFHVVVKDGDNVAIDEEHVWDRWNGRHQYTAHQKSGQTTVVTYEIYGSVSFATADGKEVPTSAVKGLVPSAKKQLWVDGYPLFMVFKLKDPGVILKLDGERADKDTPDKPAYDVLKVSFEPGAGPSDGDRYWLVVKKDTHLPAWVEWAPAGKPDDYRIAYRWDDWQDVGGLKLSLKRVNLGHESEIEVYDAVEARPTVEDELFAKEVQ
jgi:hypothetical protein